MSEHGPRLPRMVFLDHCAVWSGGEIALLRLLEPLRDADPLVVLGEEGPLVAALEDAGLRVQVLPLDERTRGLSRDESARVPLRGLWDTARYVLRLRRLLRRERPELVHANSLKSGIYGCLAARLAGVRVVWHVRDRIADDYLPRRLVRLVHVLLALLPDLVLVNSRATRDTVAGVARAVPVEVLDDPFRATPVEPRTAPVNADAPVVALVGRLAPWKGQLLFLDAVERLLTQDRSVRGRLLGSALFGEEEYGAHVHRRAGQGVLGAAVQIGSFDGSVDEVLRSVDVVVSASVIPEPFGQVVVEAIANGVPVVVPDGGGPAEIVADGVSGLTYRTGDATALADAIARVLDDGELYARLSSGGLARAKDYDPDLVAARFTELAEQATRTRRPLFSRRVRACLGR